MDVRQSDEQWMNIALELAARGQGSVEPNPMVGCVIVKDNEQIGAGFHSRFGGPHAEVAALQNCRREPAGADAFVTLEPCCHHGKTPPCSEALIAAKVARVVVADEDPFHAVAGKGIQHLRNAGIAVEVGCGRQASRRLNAPYRKLQIAKRPWVIAKWAMTLDGKIAAAGGDSQWISNEAARKIVHQLRGRVDAIIVGSQTSIADDPLLTARPPGIRVATRIVVDSRLRTSTSGQLVQTAGQFPTLLAASPDAPPEVERQLRDAGCEVLRLNNASYQERWHELIDELGRRNMTNVLVEGGGGLLGSLFDMDQVDEVHAFIAPKIVGGQRALSPVGGQGIHRMANARRLSNLQFQDIDGDIYVWGRLEKSCGR